MSTDFEDQLQSHMDTAPLPDTCTGYWQVMRGQDRPLDYQAVIHHDGDTCPIHELGIPRAER